MYHFRLVVPRDLHALMGRRIIKRSLHTRDLSAARVGAWTLSAAYAHTFAKLRGSAMAKAPSGGYVRVDSEAGDILTYIRDASTGFVKTEGPEDHANLMEYLAAEERLAKANAAAAAAREEERLAPQRAANYAVYDEMMRSTPMPEVVSSGFSVRDMITHWETLEARDMLKATAEVRRKIVEEFAAHYGEKRPMEGVRRTDVASWLAALATAGNSQSTRNNKASHLKMFFESAKRAGRYHLENPADKAAKFGKADKEARAETHGWVAFTLSQLQTIFAPSNLRRTREPHTRRALVLGLYTGARVSEVAQLRVDEFVIVDGVKCVRYQGEYKTKTTKRLVPIHPDLLRLGVWDWMEEQKKRGEVRLFPTVKLDGKSGKGNAISKGTSNLLKILKIAPKDDETTRVGFHSFRDTVIQELQGADPDNVWAERRRAYVGHAPYEPRDNSAHKLHYMRAWKPKEIAGLHAGITWGQWLDFDGLKALLEQYESDSTLKKQARVAQRKAPNAPA